MDRATLALVLLAGCPAQESGLPDGSGAGDSMGPDGATSGDSDAAVTGPARCGDGLIRDPVESCDDGNQEDGDACPATCRVCDGMALGGHCYTLHALQLGWDDARRDCATRGGHLATLSVSSEDAVATLVANREAAWIGLTDVDGEGDFVWITGEPLDFTDWEPNEPNNELGAEDCGALWWSGGWNDDDCIARWPHVCEDEGWAVSPSDWHAYKVLWLAVDEAGGREACASLGGGAHLATIESAEEQAIVAPLATTALRLGLDDQDLEGTFVWVTGEPVEYQNWDLGEPSPAPGQHANCAYMTVGGPWEVRACEDEVPALCEVE
jgi:cysteine-rich repeat protein